MVALYGQAAKFVRLAKTDPRSIKNCIYIVISYVVSEPFRDLLGSGFYENVYIAQIFPVPTDNSFLVVQQYTKALNSFSRDYKADFFSFEGYMLGRFIFEVLKRLPVISRKNFLQSIYNTKLFQIADMYLGPYSGPCTWKQSLCSCNIGLKQVFISKIAEDGSFQPGSSDPFSFPLTSCASPLSMLIKPINFVQIIPVSKPGDIVSQQIGQNINNGIQIAFKQAMAAGGINRRPVSLITISWDSTEQDIKTCLANAFDDFNIEAFLGNVNALMTPDDLNQLSVMSIGDFHTSITVPNEPFYESVAHVLSSAADDIMSLVDYAYSVNGATNFAVLYSHDQTASVGLYNTVLKSVNTYQQSIMKPTVSSSYLKNFTFSTDFGSANWVMVFDASTPMIADILRKMEQKINVNLLLTFTQYVTWGSIVQNFPISVQQRVFFASSLPSWWGKSQSNSLLLDDYIQSGGIFDPFVLKGYLLGKVKF